jgi:hypothetical protein
MSADQRALVVAVVNALTEHPLRSRRRPRPGCTHRDHPTPPVSDIKAVQGLVDDDVPASGDAIWLPAHQPVVISMAACNNDPAIRTEDQAGNRSHLAWGIGPHACPAQSPAYLIAQDAIDQLLDALPEMRLDLTAGAPTWRPGPFHRALTALPVTFRPCSPLYAYGESGTWPAPRS